jgi:hypothetical protein
MANQRPRDQGTLAPTFTFTLTPKAEIPLPHHSPAN